MSSQENTVKQYSYFNPVSLVRSDQKSKWIMAMKEKLDLSQVKAFPWYQVNSSIASKTINQFIFYWKISPCKASNTRHKPQHRARESPPFSRWCHYYTIWKKLCLHTYKPFLIAVTGLLKFCICCCYWTPEFPSGSISYLVHPQSHQTHFYNNSASPL